MTTLSKIYLYTVFIWLFMFPAFTYGIRLPICPEMRYGPECEHSCGSCLHGTCDVGSGECDSCVPGFSPPLCQTCQPGLQPPSCHPVCTSRTYGRECDQSCGHCLDNKPCDIGSGQCDSCEYGFTPPMCQTCQPGLRPPLCQSACNNGTYGQHCSQLCGNCNNNAQCDPVNGTCTSCSPGFIAPLCQSSCNNKTFGQDCLIPCGNCTRNMPCNPVDGTCTSCSPGFIPPLCQTPCKNGTYGRECLFLCGNCTGNVPCDIVNGICTLCSPGFYLPLCQSPCTHHTYGQNCSFPCGECTDDALCETVNGTCTSCKPGYVHPLCQTQCNDGLFGQNCTMKCGNCFGGHVACNKATGNCLHGCENGWKSLMCNEVSVAQDGAVIGAILGAGLLIASAILIAVFVWLRNSKRLRQSDVSNQSKAHYNKDIQKVKVSANTDLENDYEEPHTSELSLNDDIVIPDVCKRVQITTSQTYELYTTSPENKYDKLSPQYVNTAEDLRQYDTI